MDATEEIWTKCNEERQRKFREWEVSRENLGADPLQAITEATLKYLDSNTSFSESDLTCPHCGKVSVIKQGLQYHLEKRVCLRKRERAGELEPPKGEPTPNWICPLCSSDFISEAGALSHIRNRVCVKIATPKSEEKLKLVTGIRFGKA